MLCVLKKDVEGVDLALHKFNLTYKARIAPRCALGTVRREQRRSRWWLHSHVANTNTRM